MFIFVFYCVVLDFVFIRDERIRGPPSFDSWLKIKGLEKKIKKELL